MTKSACRQTAALFLLFFASTVLFAQGKDMGQAGQYYKQNTRFKITPGSNNKGDGTVHWTVGAQGHTEMEKDEYAVLENDVHVTYQDVKLAADKVTINLKTKDAVAEGHVILDQGPQRLTADHAVFNLDTKIGTFFNATGSLEPSLFFTGDKIEKISEDTLFYCRQRGLSAEDAVALVVNGFVKDVLQQLPMEFAVEAQKLISISLEGSVG